MARGGGIGGDVTEAELAILHALWDHGPAPIRHLALSVYGRGDTASYATVQKLLERLEHKGFVGRNRQAAVHVFAATVAREELIGRRLRDLAKTLCGGSFMPLVSHLIRGEKLSAGERDSLRALVEEITPIDGIDGEPPRSSSSSPSTSNVVE